MSIAFEAVVVAASESALIEVLNLIENAGQFAKFSIQVYKFSEAGFVIFGTQRGKNWTFETEETEELAHLFSRKFECTVAVHYNDQVGVATAMLSRDGKLVRYFDEEDEIWGPCVEGKRMTDGPQFTRNTIPDDIECDVMWSAIDAGLESAGFRNWITDGELCEFPNEERLIWSRPISS